MQGIAFSFPWEITLMEAVQANMEAFGIFLATLFTQFGDQYILVGGLALLYFDIDKSWGRKIGITMLSALAFNCMIKNVFWRRRPYFDNAGIKCLKPVDSSADIYDIAAQGYSFPSAHSQNAAAFYGNIARLGKKKWLIFLCYAMMLLVAVSRVCLGVHYPTDVIAGLVIGLAAVYLLPALGRLIPNDIVFYAVIALVNAVGLFYCKTEDYFTTYGILIGFLGGLLYEKRFADFQKPTKVWHWIYRFAFGIGIFFGIAQGFKLFAPDTLAVRVIRYALGTFVAIGPYTKLFALIEKKKKK